VRAARLVYGGPGATVSVSCGVETRRYPGGITVTPGRESPLRLVNTCPLDDYTLCVVGSEAGPGENAPAALRALAIIARTYALAARRHRDADVCDLAHCQVDHGLPDGAEALRVILAPTHGATLALPAGQSPVYSQCCGGVLSSPGAVWRDDLLSRAARELDELDGRILCSGSRFFNWEASAPAAGIEATLAEIVPSARGLRIVEWRIGKTDPAGRAARFDFTLPGGATVMAPAGRFASIYGGRYGWRTFRSLLITGIRLDGDRFVLHGRGLGHGVGLCWDGALALAREGYDERAILGFYFPGGAVREPDALPRSRQNARAPARTRSARPRPVKSSNAPPVLPRQYIPLPRVWGTVGTVFVTNKEEAPMKGNAKVLAKLNDLLSDELTAINQYMVHSEMCANWGFVELHKAAEKRAIDEMKHAEKLIGRILFLEGSPTVSKLGKITIGAAVEAQVANDHASESGAIKSYNDGIRLAAEIGDNGSRELMDSILKDEEVHIDYLEAQADQIKQMGIQTYLGQQVRKA
jgi:bacterioferritin